MVATIERDERCQAILRLLPPAKGGREGMSAQQLEEKLRTEHFSQNAGLQARIRVLQRDLKTLLNAEEVVVEEANAKPLRYFRIEADVVSKRKNRAMARLEELYVPVEMIERFKPSKGNPSSFFDLSDTEFLLVLDSMQLKPNQNIDTVFQSEIIRALSDNRQIKLTYRKPGAEQDKDYRLHPLGVVLRLPRYYLIAFDDKDLAANKEIPKLYLFNRIVDAAALEDARRLPEGYSLSSVAVDLKLAEFVRDATEEKVRIRVWGYVRDLLRESRIANDQNVIDDPDDAEAAIVTFSQTLSGTFRRWLMGFGDKLEVLEPDHLRVSCAAQAAKMVARYADSQGEEDDVNEDEEVSEVPVNTDK
jgi:hypothetical protein